MILQKFNKHYISLNLTKLHQSTMFKDKKKTRLHIHHATLKYFVSTTSCSCPLRRLTIFFMLDHL